VIVDRAAVLLTGADCVLLESHLGRDFERLRNRLDRFHPLFKATMEIRSAALLHTAEQSDFRNTGSLRDDPAEADGRSLTVIAAADRVGVTDRAIRAAAQHGRLCGTRNDKGHWRFTPIAVAAWQQERRRTA
jgi:hypothetical protein